LNKRPVYNYSLFPMLHIFTKSLSLSALHVVVMFLSNASVQNAHMCMSNTKW